MSQSAVTRSSTPLIPKIRSALFEIASSDPVPPRRRTLWVIVALFSVLLIWALVARIDIVSVAPGRLVPETYVKIVQPAEAGIIREILVKEGEYVASGQLLVRMDHTESAADSEANAQQIALERLQARRLEAELEGKPLTRMLGDEPVLYARVEAQYRDHKRSVEDSIGQAKAARQRVSKELSAEQENQHKLEKTAPMLRSAADSYAKLARENLVGRLEAEDRDRIATEREQDLASQRATVQSLQASLEEADRNVAQMRSRSRSELQTQLVETSARVAQLAQADVKLGFRSTNLELKAPQAGVIKDLATTTVGAVVQPGTVLLNLVPVGEQLRAQVSIRNDDIGFVHVGQKVRLKLATFPFQRYGLMEGTLLSVSPDVSSTRAEQSSRESEQSADASGYKGIIRLNDQYLDGGMGRVTIAAGMQLTAEIVEGRRTVMDYLLSPVQRVGSEAGRER